MKKIILIISFILSSIIVSAQDIMVDTVFVVSEAIPYHTKKLSELKKHFKDNEDYQKFHDLSLKGLVCGNKSCSGEDLVLYKGATFDNPVDGMYSFSPCQLASSNPLGFERIKISQADFPELNPRHCRSIKVLKNEQSQHVWKVLHDRTIASNLSCGVHFDWP